MANPETPESQTPQQLSDFNTDVPPSPEKALSGAFPPLSEPVKRAASQSDNDCSDQVTPTPSDYSGWGPCYVYYQPGPQ